MGLTLGVLLIAITPVRADIITVPDGLNPGDQYRLVFVTSTVTDSLSNDIGDYNNIVTTCVNTNAPALSALGTTWKAIVSTSAVSARVNTGTDTPQGSPTSVPIYNLQGGLVSTGNDSLWDMTDGGPVPGSYNLINPIAWNESGDLYDSAVWTGTTSCGEPQDHPLALGDFLNGEDPHTTGLAGATDWDYDNSKDPWIENWAMSPTTNLPLYGMSGVLTAPVPVPPAIWLLGSGLVALVGIRRRGRKA
jgi:hypothetical protein